MIAFTFPGQGSQHLGMGQDILEKHPEYEKYFEITSKKLGFDIKEIIFGEDEKNLTLTQNAQAAILLVSYIKYLYTKEKLGYEPDVVAGHSLGEWTALVVAEVIDFETAIECVYSRGLFMSEACSPGLGTMAAVLGMEASLIEEILKDFANVQIANYNGPMQTVISGDTSEVLLAMEMIKEKGAKKVVQLNVSGPFHSKLIVSAQENMKIKLENIKFNNPKFPIVQNVSGKYETDPENIKSNLIRQITSPVRWTEIILEMHKNGINKIVEVGPGKVLSSLNKKIVKNAEHMNI